MSFEKYAIDEKNKTYFTFWHSKWCYPGEPNAYEIHDLCKLAAILDDKVEFLKYINMFTGYSKVHLDTLFNFLKTSNDVLYDEDICPFMNYDIEYETSLWRHVGSCFDELNFYGYFRHPHDRCDGIFRCGWVHDEEEYNKIEKFLKKNKI